MAGACSAIGTAQAAMLHSRNRRASGGARLSRTNVDAVRDGWHTAGLPMTACAHN